MGRGGLRGELAEDGAMVAGGGSGGWDFAAVHENDFAGFEDGVAVDGETAMGYQMLDDGFGGGGGIGFAIGQPVAQISLAMPLDLSRCLLSGRTARENPWPSPRSIRPKLRHTSESALRSPR